MTNEATTSTASDLDLRLARLAARSAAARAEKTAQPVPAATVGTRGRTGKRHAAQGSRRMALAASAMSTVALAGYFHQVDAAAATSTAAGPQAFTAAAAAPATTSAMADGTYTGATDTNKWGPMQVQITVSSGNISQVTVVQSPNEDRKSVSINQGAVPVLTSQTLTVQSAKVNTVSGATYTSDSYAVSLQSAIDKATAAAA